ADTQAALLMAVVLAIQLVHAREGRTDKAELRDVSTEPGPKRVVRTGHVGNSGVDGQPVVDRTRVEHPGRNSRPDRAKHRHDDDRSRSHIGLPQRDSQSCRAAVRRCFGASRSRSHVGCWFAMTVYSAPPHGVAVAAAFRDPSLPYVTIVK